MEELFLALATLFLLGVAARVLGLKTSVPQVTLLIVGGIAIGPSGLDLFSEHREDWFPVVSDAALVMLGFLMGGSLTVNAFRDHGKRMVWLSIGITLGTLIVVFTGLLALGQGLTLALLLAGIATATDPAATTGVLMETQQQRSPFGRCLTGIVAIDDAWGLLIFSFCLVIASGSEIANGPSPLWQGLRDIGGALLLGSAIGLPMAFLTGRIRDGEPTLVEALGLVFLCAGLAIKFEVSNLLAAIVMGATVANLASHHNRPFRAIEGIEWPFLILFFILAGASLELNALLMGGALTLAYVVLRIAGRIISGWLTGLCLGDRSGEGGWTGLALLPQAGVAVAMAFTGSERFPQQGDMLLSVALASTVIFELLGPLATRFSLTRHP